MRYVEYEKRLSILIEKFDAEIIPKEKVLHLKRSDQVDYRYVFAVLNISHPDKLTALFTQEEKLEHQEDVEDNIKHPFDLSNVEPGTEDYVQWGIDWMEGRLITLALESKDGEYISEWEMHADSSKLNAYLSALTGAVIQEKTKENGTFDSESFEYYLDNLQAFDFLGKK